MTSSHPPRVARLLRPIVGRLRSAPLARAFSDAVGIGESLDREGMVTISSVAVMGSGLRLCLMASVLADVGDTTGGQILVAATAIGGSIIGSVVCGSQDLEPDPWNPLSYHSSTKNPQLHGPYC
jgi:hypothetical protein